MRILLCLFLYASFLSAQSITFRTPAVYELVHVAFALTDYALENPSLTDTSSVYFKEVRKRFGKFAQHPHVRYLDKEIREDYRFYLDMRTSSLGYQFNETNEIESLSQFSWERDVNYYITFGRIRRSWADFAQTIGFQQFYEEHQSFYQTLQQQAASMLAAEAIQRWLEDEFPERYAGYDIILSPLAYQTHQTFRYELDGAQFGRVFINAPNTLPFYGSTNRNQAMYNGIFFTEIDHNYVNPISEQYSGIIRRIFRDRSLWVDESGTDARYYEGAMKVFNEYMTHAVYLLWVYEYYPKTDADFIAERRFRLMQRRGYKRFRPFYESLHAVYTEGQPQTLTERFPQFLERLKNP